MPNTAPVVDAANAAIWPQTNPTANGMARSESIATATQKQHQAMAREMQATPSEILAMRSPNI
jgi:hypothetical protein